MSAKRGTLYAIADVPTTITTAYTSTGNTHIDKVTVCNDTAGGITISVTVASIPVYDLFSIAANTQVSLDLLANHGLDAGEIIQVTASAANLNMVISGRDF